MTDALLDAIVAAPDDDAPRLVWADREGGDRAELVVIQCRLAQRDVPRAERRRLLRRERDLLTINRERWTRALGLHDQIVPDFARGFVEHVKLRTDVFIREARALAELPTLRSIELLPISLADGTLSPVDARADLALKLSAAFALFARGRIRAIAGIASWEHGMGDDFAELVAHSPSLRDVAALEIGNQASREGVVYLRRLPRLERLALPEHRLGPDAAWEVLEEIPTLHRLALGRGALAIPPPTSAARLTELDVFEFLPPHAVRALLERTPSLQILSLHAPVDDELLTRISELTPRLRALTLRRAQLTAASIDTLLSFGSLESLWLVDQEPILPRSALEEVIPDVHLP